MGATSARGLCAPAICWRARWIASIKSTNCTSTSASVPAPPKSTSSDVNSSAVSSRSCSANAAISSSFVKTPERFESSDWKNWNVVGAWSRSMRPMTFRSALPDGRVGIAHNKQMSAAIAPLRSLSQAASHGRRHLPGYVTCLVARHVPAPCIAARTSPRFHAATRGGAVTLDPHPSARSRTSRRRRCACAPDGAHPHGGRPGGAA